MQRTANSREPPADPTQLYPEVRWLLDTQSRHMRDARWLPLLVEFDREAVVQSEEPKVSAIQAFARLQWIAPELRTSVYVAPFFLNPPRLVLKCDPAICVIWVWDADLERLLNQPRWIEVVRQIEVGPTSTLPNRGGKSAEPSAASPRPTKEPVLAEVVQHPQSRRVPASKQRGVLRTDWALSWFRQLFARAVPQATGSQASNTPQPSGMATVPVLTVVLDDGIAFAHERFRFGGQTRIKYFWNQDGTKGPPPPGLFGTELSDAAINAAVAGSKASGLADDAQVYRTHGDLDTSRDGYKAILQRRSHGTHVLDLVAGDDPAAADPNRWIVAVQMPELAIADTSATALTPYKVAGIFYALERAETLLNNAGGHLPVVVNLSYGRHQGSHRGNSLLERLVDDLVNASVGTSTPFRVVFAAGNHRQGRTHAALTLATTQSRSLQWRIQPDDRTPSVLQIWPRAAGAKVQVSATSPTGASFTLASGQWKAATAPYIFGIYHHPITAHFSVRVEPTAPRIPLDRTQPVAEAGIWTIDITNTGNVATEIDLYIRRDDTLRGRRSMGRQSYFDDAKYERFDQAGRPNPFDPNAKSPITRRGTLSGHATGSESCVIGGYRRSDMTPALYSSSGPVASGAVRAAPSPNWLAPSDDSIAHRGVLAAGTRSGSRVAMSGTSVAAPQAARWLVDEFAQGRKASCTPPANLLQPPNGVPAGEVFNVAGAGLMKTPPMYETRGRPGRHSLAKRGFPW